MMGGTLNMQGLGQSADGVKSFFSLSTLQCSARNERPTYLQT